MASKKRSLVINVSPFEEVDPLEDASAYNGVIANAVKNRLFEAEELALTKVIAAGAANTVFAKADLAATDEAAVKQIQDLITGIQLYVDDFKAYSENVVVLVHPEVAKIFSRVQGQSYSTGTNTFPEGLGKGFRFDGIDFFVSPVMNAILSDSTTGTEKVAGAIVMDAEAYANSGLEKTVKTFDQQLADERFIGHTYHELDVVVDKERIAILELSKPAKAGVSKKVSEK